MISTNQSKNNSIGLAVETKNEALYNSYDIVYN